VGVVGPVQRATLVVGREGVAEAFGRVERLVRVEALEHRQPVVGRAVALEEVEARGKALGTGEVGLVLHHLAGHHVLEALARAV